jgi:hypothetical protein
MNYDVENVPKSTAWSRRNRQKHKESKKKSVAKRREEKINAGDVTPTGHIRCVECKALKTLLEARLSNWKKLPGAANRGKAVCNECNT